MTEIKWVTDLIDRCRDVDKYGELLTLLKLYKTHEVLWMGGHANRYDIKCDGLKIEVKSCNINNKWAEADRRKDPRYESTFSRIKPEELDYLVGVSFNKDFGDVKFYIFTPEEVRLFDKSDFRRSPDQYNIDVQHHNDERRNVILRDAKDAWDKIRQRGCDAHSVSLNTNTQHNKKDTKERI